MSFVLTVGDRDYTVRVVSTTSVLGSPRFSMSLSNIKMGDTVRVFGLANATSRTIDASIVRDVSINY
jgi:hypothetical protein